MGVLSNKALVPSLPELWSPESSPVKFMGDGHQRATLEIGSHLWGQNKQGGGGGTRGQSRLTRMLRGEVRLPFTLLLLPNRDKDGLGASP